MNRIESVDIFRFVAIVAVITIHTSPFRSDATVGNEAYNYIDFILNQISRFAVPFFFIISGYFWGAKIRNGSDPVLTTRNMAKRILLIYLAWCFIYILPVNISSIYEHGILGPLKLSYWKIRDLTQDPMTLLVQGTKIHLWFLFGMLCALALSAFLIINKNTKILFVLALSMYFFGVLARSYSNTPIGIDIDFNTRNGPFFSTLPFVTGYFLSGINARHRWAFYGLFLFILGSMLHFFEAYFLWKSYNTPPTQDYMFGTFFMGLGVAVSALSNHPGLKSKTFSDIGKMTLGIYAVHFIFIDLLTPLDKVLDSVFWEVGYLIVVIYLSILAAKLLSKYKLTNRIVV
ncbi:acyltransferase [Corallincola spongiicola]|uniref:Acyltransferase 3 domain-containing protein n=1 Tax=Corallincola spongiicola TaxID=2520508 RepID=A0ABY1WPV1_9GAMM|nr:acyltransferase [Corallincola spongiicola]TAA46754.1 hypothetical protein EXY25_05730 [Corallincola spongiicola]